MSVKISGKFIEHIACTSQSCNSSDAMAVYQQSDGTHDATCFSCGHYDSDPLINATQSAGHPPVRNTEVRSTLSVPQVSECPLLPLPTRDISQKTASFYGVRTILNGLDGKTPVAWCFPYYKPIYNKDTIVGYKKRTIEQKIFTSIGDCKDTLLFGLNKFPSGGNRLYITEGEIDCLSLYQVLKDLSGVDYKHLDPCVVSLPHGAASAARSLSNKIVQERLSKFKEIVLVFDQDPAGREAVSSVCSFLDPKKTKIATFSEKDPNDMLRAGKSTELKWAVLTQAQPHQPEGITTSEALAEAALRPSKQGSPWPWPSLTKLTYGRHAGLYGLGAGVGVMKTAFFHELIYFIAQEDQKPVGIFLLEEAPQRTLRVLAGKHLSTPLHRPDVEYNQSDVEAAIAGFNQPTEKLYFFDHKGSRDWDTIYTQCKYLAAVHGVRDIIIDPLTAVISHEENTDRALHKIMADMSTLTQDPYNCTVYFSSHLNEPPRDRIPHEEGGSVKESHFAGSRAMIRFSNYIFAGMRNKREPDVVKRNTTKFEVLKDRDNGTATGQSFEIYYDTETGRYQEFNDSF